MIWIIGGIAAAFVIWLGLTIALLAAEDNRIRNDPWIRPGLPAVVRSSAVELAREAQRIDRVLEHAALLLDGQ